MPNQKNQESVEIKNAFTTLVSDERIENMYPTRDADNKKLDVTDLFTHFTASIIQENVPFTR